MAKIRFEDVTIKAGAIELDGIEDPSNFMKGLGLQSASVKRGLCSKCESREASERFYGDDVCKACFGYLTDEVKSSDNYTMSGNRQPWEDAAPPVVNVPDETPPAAQIEEAKEKEKEEEQPRVEITPDQFTKARRLRDVVQVFMDANITDVDEIVDTCVLLKSKVSILGRMSDIPGRMPIAVSTWLEQNAQ